MREIDASAIDLLPAKEQEEARKLLASLQAQYEANPLLGYEPHEKQDEFHKARTYIKAFMGGNRSGKTTAGIVDDIIQAVDRDCLPETFTVTNMDGTRLRTVPAAEYKKFEPPFHCRIICPSESIMESIVFQKLREWMPKDQYVGNEWGKAFSKSRRILNLKNGSYFDFLTYEQDVDKHGGAAKHRIHYDEVPPYDIWHEGKMRLSDYKGADALFTMTPLEGLNWAYDDLWVPWEKGRLKDGFIVTVDIDDNPYLDQAQKDKTLEGYSSAELSARKSGRFVHFAGMIYPEFSRSEHVIPERSIPKGAYVYVGIDPGVRIMAAAIWAYVTSEGQIIIFDEIALPGANVADTCKAIKIINTKHGPEAEHDDDGKMTREATPIKPRAYIIDPAAGNRVHQTGRSDQQEYTDQGIYTVLGQNAVPAGISRIKVALERKKLQIMANCPQLIDEFRKYRWKSPGRTEDDPKEAPIKQDDHLLDALRYIAMFKPHGPPLLDKAHSQTQVEFLIDQERKELNKPNGVHRASGIPI